MKKLKRQQAFTLAEMLIVLMLIGLVAGAISINLRKALRAERFWSEVSTFKNHLQFAQDLMLMTDADVHFKIKANEAEKGIQYWIETDKPFSASFSSFIKKVHLLKAVHHVAYPDSQGSVIDLKFLSKGSILSSGNLQLSSKLNKEETLIAHIALTGHLNPISYSDKKPENQQGINSDTYLTESLVQDILMADNEKK